MADRTGLLGNVVVGVWIADDRKALRFDTDTGEQIVARCDADCCSETWIEGIDAPQALLGRVVSVEDIDMPDLGDMLGRDVVAYYGLKITTENGSCVIDYRNDSNGYYGGSIEWPGEYFYGGVYGQNESEMVWRPLEKEPA